MHRVKELWCLSEMVVVVTFRIIHRRSDPCMKSGLVGVSGINTSPKSDRSVALIGEYCETGDLRRNFGWLRSKAATVGMDIERTAYGFIWQSKS